MTWCPNSPAPVRPPVHGPADHEPGAQTRTEMEIREGPAAPDAGAGPGAGPHRDPERRRVGVLVHDHRQPEPPGQRGPQGEPVPLGETRHPVQHPQAVVERPRERDPHTQR